MAVTKKKMQLQLPKEPVTKLFQRIHQQNFSEINASERKDTHSIIELKSYADSPTLPHLQKSILNPIEFGLDDSG